MTLLNVRDLHVTFESERGPVRAVRGVDLNLERGRTLWLVGIREPAKRASDFPHEFSGGMRQRVVIAMAVANNPDLIIADEPTTALDVTVQAQILETLRTAQRETGAGVLLITHNLGVVAGYADDVDVMYAGKVVEQALVEPAFAAPRMPYTIGLLGAVPTVSSQEREPLTAIPGEPPQLAAEPTGCPFADRCPAAVEACRQGEPQLRQVGPGHTAACVRADEIAAGTLDVASLFERGPVPEPAVDRHESEEVLRVRGLVKTYPITKGAILRRTVGRTTAVRGVDLDLRAGETLGLVGESGSGKSSTLMELMRLAPPESGSVELLGTPITDDLTSADRSRIRSGVQLVMQDVSGSLSPRLTVYDILAEPLQVSGLGRSAIESRVYELLDLVGVDRSAVDRFPSAFSGGQRQRIGIARALALGPRVVILDEPVSALDMSVQAEVLNLLVHLQKRLAPVNGATHQVACHAAAA